MTTAANPPAPTPHAGQSAALGRCVHCDGQLYRWLASEDYTFCPHCDTVCTVKADTGQPCEPCRRILGKR